MGLEDKTLAVARHIIFQGDYWQGLKTENLDYYLNLIKNNHEFLVRANIEKDDSWQQIIPYILFKYRHNYFIYQYLKKATEKRLKNDYLLGIGGHIDSKDVEAQDVLEAGAMREWQEEVDYQGELKQKKLIGIINDDSRPVEKVHLGLVYVFEGDSPNIRVREKEILKGRLVPFSKLGFYMQKTQGWAPIIYKEYLSQFHEKK